MRRFTAEERFFKNNCRRFIVEGNIIGLPITGASQLQNDNTREKKQLQAFDKLKGKGNFDQYAGVSRFWGDEGKFDQFQKFHSWNHKGILTSCRRFAVARKRARPTFGAYHKTNQFSLRVGVDSLSCSSIRSGSLRLFRDATSACAWGTSGVVTAPSVHATTVQRGSKLRERHAFSSLNWNHHCPLRTPCSMR